MILVLDTETTGLRPDEGHTVVELAAVALRIHPHELFQRRWRGFYLRCCENLHMYPEGETELDARLADWNQKHWDQTTANTECTLTNTKEM